MAKMPEHDEPHPGGLPQDEPSQGEHLPSERRTQRGRPRSARLVWLIVGSVAILLLGVVGIAFAAGGFGGSTSKQRSAAPSRTFTHAPPGCDMVKPATITMYTSATKVAKYISGAKYPSGMWKHTTACLPGPRYEEERSGSGRIFRTAGWKAPDIEPGNGLMVGMNADLTVSPVVRQTYGPRRNGIISEYRHYYNVTDAHQVSGLGDAAYIIYGTNHAHDPVGIGHVALITYWGNAEIQVTYDGSHQSPGTPVEAVGQQTAEAAVLAIARDIYASLS